MDSVKKVFHLSDNEYNLFIASITWQHKTSNAKYPVRLASQLLPLLAVCRPHVIVDFIATSQKRSNDEAAE
jgi:hypothetical protein